jgi:hypothetical protein
MGVKELLTEFLVEVEEPTRSILADVLLAEHRKLDMERPQLKSEIKEIIEARVHVESRGNE